MVKCVLGSVKDPSYHWDSYRLFGHPSVCHHGSSHPGINVKYYRFSGKSQGSHNDQVSHVRLTMGNLLIKFDLIYL